MQYKELEKEASIGSYTGELNTGNIKHLVRSGRDRIGQDDARRFTSNGQKRRAILALKDDA